MPATKEIPKTLPPAVELVRRLESLRVESREVRRLLRIRQSIDRADGAREARNAS
jgi:hypothetical protein